MSEEFRSLRSLSARIGADPYLVQAAGGNTSIKQDNTMWIKASGTWLKDAAHKDIFVPLNYPELVASLAMDDPDCESCLKFIRTEDNHSNLRPSIETSVHGLMPQSVVLHVHCVNTIAWAIAEDAETYLAQRMVGFNWAFIPYARPGLNLSRAIRQRLKPSCNVLVLGNHGLVVAAETVAEAETLLDVVVHRLALPARPKQAADMAALTEMTIGTDYVPASSPETHALAFDNFALGEGCANVFYPDHVVFLGKTLSNDFASNAPAIVIKRRGVLIHKSAKAAVEPMVRCVSDVFRRIGPQTKLRPLTELQIEELLNWDAEKYRQKN